MHLRNACARPGRSLHDALALLSAEADAKHLLDALAKVLPYNALHMLPVIRRSIVEHAREHLLELGRQDGTLHGDGLANLQVQPAVGVQEVEDTLGVAGMQVIQRVDEPRVLPEVDLVIQAYYQACLERAKRPEERALQVEAVDGVSDAEDGGEVDESARPSPALRRIADSWFR